MSDDIGDKDGNATPKDTTPKASAVSLPTVAAMSRMSEAELVALVEKHTKQFQMSLDKTKKSSPESQKALEECQRKVEKLTAWQGTVDSFTTSEAEDIKASLRTINDNLKKIASRLDPTGELASEMRDIK